MSEDTSKEKAVEASDSDGALDAETQQTQYKYPYQVFFIVVNEFCERFNYYGMRTILALYLTRYLNFSDDNATIIYHSFSTLVYFFCIPGGIIADSWWGKFNTILWLSIVYVAGSVTVTLGSIQPWIGEIGAAKALTFAGLFLIALGSGGIKPCVAAFGGEQFRMPNQAKQLGVFFSMFYFSINLGSFISTLVTPILREDVKCFDMIECYPFGFGLPAILMAVSIVIFLAGRFMYRILPNQGNMIMKVIKCISNANKMKKIEQATNPRSHWLEYAEPAYGKKLVMETKVLLNVLVLYLPLPLFWALFDQQGSRWTFQATRMNGDLGSFYTIKPDQMQVINPLLILVFIPLYELIFYPLLNLIGVNRPLQKITLGGIFAGVAFLCSMGVEIALEPTYPVLPQWGESQLRIYNGRSCNYNIGVGNGIENFELKENAFHLETIPVTGDNLTITINAQTSSPGCSGFSETVVLDSGKANGVFFERNSILKFEDSPDKSRQGRPAVRILTNYNLGLIELKEQKDKDQEVYEFNSTSYRNDVVAGDYSLSIANKTAGSDIKLKLGGVYAIIVNEKGTNDYLPSLVIVSEPNSMSMLWLVPQYVIMTLGEVMYSVTGLQFSYTQAPESMKSVLQGCWLLTVAVGNLIVTIIVGAKFFDSQVYEFMLFAILMFVDMGIFSWLGWRYKPIPLSEIAKAEEEDRQLLDEKKSSPLEN